MKKISRIEADSFFSINEVTTRNIYQIGEALWIHFIFNNGNLLVVKYDHVSKEKSYFAMRMQAYPEKVRTPQISAFDEGSNFDNRSLNRVKK